jgi:hypothetical protein
MHLHGPVCSGRPWPGAAAERAVTVRACAMHMHACAISLDSPLSVSFPPTGIGIGSLQRSSYGNTLYWTRELVPHFTVHSFSLDPIEHIGAVRTFGSQDHRSDGAPQETEGH